MEGDDRVKARPRKPPEKDRRPWTAARTMEVLSLRRCPLAIAQRLVHCAIALSTAVLGQSQRQCPLHCCWRTTWTTRSKRGPTCSAQLHLHTHEKGMSLLLTRMMMSWCLMSSDVIWHIRDKLWPKPKHGSLVIILYVHGNQKAR